MPRCFLLSEMIIWVRIAPQKTAWLMVLIRMKRESSTQPSCCPPPIPPLSCILCIPGEQMFTCSYRASNRLMLGVRQIAGTTLLKIIQPWFGAYIQLGRGNLVKAVFYLVKRGHLGNISREQLEFLKHLKSGLYISMSIIFSGWMVPLGNSTCVWQLSDPHRTNKECDLLLYQL